MKKFRIDYTWRENYHGQLKRSTNKSFSVVKAKTKEEAIFSFKDNAIVEINIIEVKEV